MSRMRYISFYCKCGASWKGIIHEYAVPSITEEWKRCHSGEGCARVDAKTARDRRKKEARDV